MSLKVPPEKAMGVLIKRTQLNAMVHFLYVTHNDHNTAATPNTAVDRLSVIKILAAETLSVNKANLQYKSLQHYINIQICLDMLNYTLYCDINFNFLISQDNEVQ